LIGREKGCTYIYREREKSKHKQQLCPCPREIKES
jgi:hypothetical protein